MKTLDEVIKAFSEVNMEVGCGDCQFNDADSDDIPCEMNDCFFNDALHYLRKYRATMDDIEAERMLYFKYMERETDNSPLSWNELRTMEGKPVWATFDNENGTWYIAKVYDDEVVLYEWGQEFGVRISGTWDYTPKRWQAYRKEKK